MKIIAIYPGRFQPFGPHHHKAYTFLSSIFGPDTYITTSNKVDSDSPFNFSEKLTFISKVVDKNKVIQCISPYRPVELLNNFDPENDVAIFAYSAKDVGRLAYSKASGEPGYFQPYNPNEKCLPFSKHGYVFILPEITYKFKGKIMSGTVLRQFLQDLSKMENQTTAFMEFKKVFRITDRNFYSRIIKKFK